MSTAAVPWEPASSGALRARAGRLTSLAVGPADPRRALQLGLAGLWLLDGILQFQPYMFTASFAHQIIAPAATGNPSIVAAPINTAAHQVAIHPVPANLAFATVQLALGLGIAWRSSVRIALAASIGWALSVWWLGEGLGGLLTGQAGPLTGGPGAALLYALAAILLWPRRDDPAVAEPVRDPESLAVERIGAPAARLTWLALWGLLAGYALDATGRSGPALHDALASMADGQPGWLAAIGTRAATIAGQDPLAVSALTAITCLVIAAAAFGSAHAMRVAIGLATGFATVIWVGTQALGGLVGGQSTDPNTGPLLILIALAYWPLASRAETSDEESAC